MGNILLSEVILKCIEPARLLLPHPSDPVLRNYFLLSIEDELRREMELDNSDIETRTFDEVAALAVKCEIKVIKDQAARYDKEHVLNLQGSDHDDFVLKFYAIKVNDELMTRNRQERTTKEKVVDGHNKIDLI